MKDGTPVLQYNPDACKANPALCEFAKMHETGHIRLGHFEHPRSWYTASNTASIEMAADCYAATHVSKAAVQAAVANVLKHTSNSGQHGSGPQRARRIQDAAAGGACHL
jgi:hypothetical protein